MSIITYTKEQKEIFSFVEFSTGHGIIDAVAGSGKTTTIIDSAKFIDKNKKILFCAFNKSIKDEISKKFKKQNLSNVVTSTIHGLGFSIIKEYDFLRNPVINDKKYDLILKELLEKNKEIIKIFQFLLRNIEFRRIEGFTKKICNNLIELNNKYRLTLCLNDRESIEKMNEHYSIVLGEKYKDEIEELEKRLLITDEKKDPKEFSEIKNKIIYLQKKEEEEFQEDFKYYILALHILLKEGNLLTENKKIIDFNDMLYIPFKYKLNTKKQYDFLFIDECQDLSRSQLAIVLKCVKPGGRMLSVGDPSQSIYGFTGADIEAFNRIKNIPNTRSLKLLKCFRCPDNILVLARQYRDDIKAFDETRVGIIQKISDKEVLSYLQEGDLVISRAKKPIQELIYELLLKDYYLKVHQDEIKEFIYSLKNLFKKNEINNSIFLKGFIAENSFQKKSVINRNTFFIKKRLGKDCKPIILDEEIRFLNNKIEFIIQLILKYKEITNLNLLFQKIEKLISGQKGKEHSISLSTIHRAKGLENNRVFILSYDKLPGKGKKDWETIQERNIHYVALTRAKDALFLVSTDDKSNKEDKYIDSNKESLIDRINNQSEKSLFDSLEGMFISSEDKESLPPNDDKSKGLSKDEAKTQSIQYEPEIKPEDLPF